MVERLCKFESCPGHKKKTYPRVKDAEIQRLFLFYNVFSFQKYSNQALNSAL